MSKPVNYFYEFGPFLLDAGKRLLLRDGDAVPLTPKAFETLLVLVQNHGQVMEKDKLMQEVWADTIVEESGLTRNISVLRRTLGESPDQHQYIVTVPGRGYCFVAGVRELPDEPPDLIVEKRTRSRIIREEEVEMEGQSDGEIERGRDGERERRGEGEKRLFSAPASLVSASPRSLASVPLRRRTAFLMIGGSLLVLALAFTYWGVMRRAPSATTSVAVKSIAVLPFKPLVAESRDEYLQMGMADVLITRLSNLKQIIVRPTSAVHKYADLEQDPVAAGRELKVEAVLEGNLQRLGDHLRVTVRLVRVSDGGQLWAEQFDQQFTDIFRVQDAMAEKLAAALALELTSEETHRLTKRGTESTEAFQAYVKGRYFLNKWSKANLEKAVEYFEQALKADPNYALAHSGLADSYHLLGYLGFAPPREVYPQAEVSASKALALDDALSEAHLSLAKQKLFYDWDWPGFEREIKRALDLDPNSADAQSIYAVYFISRGRFDEAIARRKIALDLDPLSPLHTNAMGWPYYFAHRFDEAIVWYQKALELDPNFIVAHNDLGTVYSQQGKFDAAVDEWLKAKTIAKAKLEEIEALRQAYAASGIKGYWQKELELAQERLQQGRVGAWQMARICAALGDKDQAFAWLEKGYAERNNLLILLKVAPHFDSLHGDARHADLLRRIGLAP